MNRPPPPEGNVEENREDPSRATCTNIYPYYADDTEAAFREIVSKLLHCATANDGCDYSQEFNTLFRHLKALIASDLNEKR
jgi:hypothetical protein